MSEISINNITKSYVTTQKALKGISLEIQSGHLVSLLGPSGCGKTTLLRIIAGLEQMDEGQLLYNGQDFSEIPVQKRNIGMVFQNYALFPNLNILQNVMFGLEMRGINKIVAQKRAEEWLDRVKLRHKKDSFPHELSGGQQQRVALARALVTEPQILLLDEPLSALDAAVRMELRNEIRQLQFELGITTLYVTHDQAEALAISDRIAVLNEGSLVEMGTPETIYQNPQNIFTAEFIGVATRLDGVITSIEPCKGIFENNIEFDLPKLINEVNPGDKISVLVRAEKINIAEPDERGAIPGKYLMHSFHGGEVQYKLELFCGKNILVNCPIEKYTNYDLGQILSICIPQSACHIYDYQYGKSLIAQTI